ncbi:probable pterin-4-alpha-carbinolamine dehydratase, chloroplastic [Humulus lupulus]|uniref:probable pterin-4-alpha-carbinolamine dehydratase, chloroplastic n=1 Tax=Humulus lupulus TaxID=3486 RepID=UPI002B4123F3|nr:probable pterin-4-alpha-carbinolamine dehydratase, chloroplastic [Humulus lupulus]
MATAHLSFPLRLPHLSDTPCQCQPTGLFSVSTRSRLGLRLRAMGSDMLGDFGARDPFPAEVESRFGEKVLGQGDTEHKILIPNLNALSLAQQQCDPHISPLQPPMSEDEATKLLKKVIGWRLVKEEGNLKLQCLWKLRDYQCGIELINRIYKVVESTGHFPNLHLEQPSQIRAVLWTSSIGGLSMNDFIVAAKIDEIKTSDLVPRKRVWA